MTQSLATLCIYILVILHTSFAFSDEESFVLINGLTDETLYEFGPHIDERISPCSTFKITLSLMGYDAGILLDERSPAWDFQEGYDDDFDTWTTTLTPKSWMQHSALWYSKIVALQLGYETIQNYLSAFDYGNQDIAGGHALPGPQNPAWIKSSLQITPREQVVFIQKMVLGKLPISSLALQSTKAILYKEDLPEGWKLVGKTGWSGPTLGRDGQRTESGWFVGWIEKDQAFCPFAYLIQASKIHLEQRIPRVKRLLLESHIMDLR